MNRVLEKSNELDFSSDEKVKSNQDGENFKDGKPEIISSLSKEVFTSKSSFEAIDLLDDVASVALLGKKPKNVMYAVNILIAIIIYDLIDFVIGMLIHSYDSVALFLLLTVTFIRIFVVIDINNRRKFSRIIYAFLASFRFIFLAILALTYSELDAIRPEYIIEMCMLGIIVALEITAVILLFSKTSRNWYNSNKKMTGK